MSTGPVTLLRGGGAALAVDGRGGVPRVVHWGADLGPLDDAALLGLADSAVPARLNATPDEALRFSLLPTEDDAWTGRPAAAIARGGRSLHPRFRLVRHEADSTRARFELADPIAGAEVVVELEIDAHGVLESRRSIRNIGSGDLAVDQLDASLPVPGRATEVLDFTGAWIGERAPQRMPIVFGAHVREQRRGRTGHDAAFVTIVGTAGFRNRTGEVWAMHVAWSGDQSARVERLPDGAGGLAVALSGGELLRRGDVVLGAGKSYEAPSVVFTWSGAGLDGLSDRFHAHLRARPNHPTGPRPLTLNTWEAVYLEHDEQTLLRLADRAASVGVERFVLDDGWFNGRSTDSAGLGDWWVDAKRWPRGLHPLVDRVRGHGMEFGLWVEPEMLNPDSDTARNHPDWYLTPSDGWASRSQHVLDVSRPDVAAYLLERLDALVCEYRIDYLKWDHNRDLLEASSHGQTLAVYALIDELRMRHPRLEIESCASGGARVDLGILERTDRVWPSDTNDPIERQRIQRWTSLLLPPELVGAHVADARSHTTGRTSDPGFRFATALFSHAGIELDLLQCGPDELESLTRFASTYREIRDLLRNGSLVHADLDDPGLMLHGILSADRERAVFCWVQLDTTVASQPGRVQFPGLDPASDYLVRVRTDLVPVLRGMTTGPAWFDQATAGGIRMPGAVLALAGVPLPPLQPGSAVLLDLARVHPAATIPWS